MSKNVRSKEHYLATLETASAEELHVLSKVLVRLRAVRQGSGFGRIECVLTDGNVVQYLLTVGERD